MVGRPRLGGHPGGLRESGTHYLGDQHPDPGTAPTQSPSGTAPNSSPVLRGGESASCALTRLLTGCDVVHAFQPVIPAFGGGRPSVAAHARVCHECLEAASFFASLGNSPQAVRHHQKPLISGQRCAWTRGGIQWRNHQAHGIWATMRLIHLTSSLFVVRTAPLSTFWPWWRPEGCHWFRTGGTSGSP